LAGLGLSVQQSKNPGQGRQAGGAFNRSRPWPAAGRVALCSGNLLSMCAQMPNAAGGKRRADSCAVEDAPSIRGLPVAASSKAVTPIDEPIPKTCWWRKAPVVFAISWRGSPPPAPAQSGGVGGRPGAPRCRSARAPNVDGPADLRGSLLPRPAGLEVRAEGGAPGTADPPQMALPCSPRSSNEVVAPWPIQMECGEFPAFMAPQDSRPEEVYLRR
jgi:hypothetical protein